MCLRVPGGRRVSNEQVYSKFRNDGTKLAQASYLCFNIGFEFGCTAMGVFALSPQRETVFR